MTSELCLLVLCRCSSCHSDSGKARSRLILPSVASGRLYGKHRNHLVLPCIQVRTSVQMLVSCCSSYALLLYSDV